MGSDGESVSIHFLDNLKCVEKKREGIASPENERWRDR